MKKINNLPADLVMVEPNFQKSEALVLRRKKRNYRNQRKVITLFKKFASLKKPRLSLEVGCGDGYFTEVISNYSNQVVATDIKNNLAPSVLKKKNVTFKMANATNLPFRQKFDLVFSIDVIEHIKNNQKFINENLRVLKSGGLLIIATPNKKRLVNRILGLLGKSRHYPFFLGYDYMGEKVIHIHEFTKMELLNLINQANLKTTNCCIIGCYLGVSGNLGLINCPKIFENFCGTWFLIAKKI